MGVRVRGKSVHHHHQEIGGAEALHDPSKERVSPLERLMEPIHLGPPAELHHQQPRRRECGKTPPGLDHRSREEVTEA